MEPLAALIRSLPSIKGIMVANHPHKIGLFVDDVILTLTDPLASLMSVESALNRYSEISYYKVNIKKSSTLPIGLPKELLLDIKTWSQYQWETNSLTYLGISLTAPTSQTYEVNYKTLLQSISKEFSNIAKFELSWLGRVATFKMLILPKILYYFHTVPIPKIFFCTVDA